MKDFAQALGANPPELGQHLFRVYVPSHDRRGNRNTAGQQAWVAKLGRLLTELAGGITALYANGAWFNPTTGETTWETPAIIYAFIPAAKFHAGLPELRTALHDMGTDLKQASVAFELDNRFYTIDQFDKTEEKAA